VIDLHHPLVSLREGHWFKLICGASFQHLPAIRNLTLAYTLAGADCIDVAADPAVISAAQEALRVASGLVESARLKGFTSGNPWLMVSLNDGEDPHFRKAEFDVAHCPIGCPRPCEAICPAQAIVFEPISEHLGLNQEAGSFSGVLSDRCYGCGRCVPVCPIQHISTRSYVYTPEAIAPLILEMGVDALEIHTQVGRFDDFKRLWLAITPWLDRLRLIAISCPDGQGLVDYLWALNQLIQPLPCPLIWQTDGRPMSGDIGMGTTKATVKLGQKVLATGLPGFVQLAGGTNQHTVVKLRELGLLQNEQVRHLELERELREGSATAISSTADVASTQVSFPPVSRSVAGVAYGSYARALLAPVLEELEKMTLLDLQKVNQLGSRFQSKATHGTSTVGVPRSPSKYEPGYLENYPDLLWQAVNLANSLTAPLKSTVKRNSLS
jgi:Fe-S-cluster-containing hydrogenase component 2